MANIVLALTFRQCPTIFFYDLIKINKNIFTRRLIRCGCDECVTSRQEDSLRHSRSRINAYRALASPSLIALSSKDPILTAFELSWELRRLSFLEHEFKVRNFKLKVFKFLKIFLIRMNTWNSEGNARILLLHFSITRALHMNSKFFSITIQPDLPLSMAKECI